MWLAVEDGGLTLELAYRAVDIRNAHLGRSVAHDVACGKVVAAVDNDVATLGKRAYVVLIDTHDVSDVVAGSQLAASYAASPSITAKGDTLYMSGLTSTIYRHVFSTGETTLMADAKDYVDNCGIIYNTCAVHPRTGEVVLNSIKGYGTSYLTNNITFFDFSGETPAVSANYEGHTRFPAGTFFTSNFE